MKCKKHVCRAALRSETPQPSPSVQQAREPRIDNGWLVWSPQDGVYSAVLLQPEHYALIAAVQASMVIRVSPLHTTTWT